MFVSSQTCIKNKKCAPLICGDTNEGVSFGTNEQQKGSIAYKAPFHILSATKNLSIFIHVNIETSKTCEYNLPDFHYLKIQLNYFLKP
jgi:hypothetical protein